MPRAPLDDGLHSTDEVAEILGVNRMRVHRLADHGHMTPTVPADGVGTRMRWSDQDIAEARRILARVDWGMTHEAAARAVDPPLPTFTTAEA